MRILVTGANGQVGRELTSCSIPKGFDILALSHGALDITDPTAVHRKVGQADVSLVVNAAAYTDVDQAESEPDLAFRVNRDGPANLASACTEARIPLVHISTDYVFDGRKRGPYLETDPVSPLGVYGMSKAAGEVEVRDRLQEHVILRSSWVYGIHGHNFVKTMLRLGRENDVIRVVADQFGCPTYAADLAETILLIAEKFNRDRRIDWGTYHYCGRGVTSWHGFAEAIFGLASQHTRLRVNRIEPISTAEYPTQAERPANSVLNSVLNCSLVKKYFGIVPKPWNESLARMLKRVL
jgi:dTDP-4-dehydrorhamnose reductase